MPLESRALILAKVEPTYGTDAAPTITENAILTSKPSIELISEDKEREVVLPYFGSLASIPIATGIKISFDVEVRGSGFKTTPPRIGALLRACGFTQVLRTGAVQYIPNSAQDAESITIYFYHDGILYKALGCVGNSVKLNCKTNETAKLSFEFTGLFGGSASLASDAIFPTPAFGDAANPLVFRSAIFQFGTLSISNAIIESLELTCSNTVVKRPDANSAYGIKRYSITGREIGGSFDPEVIALETWNPWSIYETGTLSALSVSIGDTEGNRFDVYAPNCQIEAPKLGGREGIQTYSIGFKVRRHLTNAEEIEFTFD